MNELNDFIEENGGYWSIHPDFPIKDWQNEVRNEDTRNGYWEWAYNKSHEAKVCPGCSSKDGCDCGCEKCASIELCREVGGNGCADD